MGQNLQVEVLSTAMTNLKIELAAMDRSEKNFLARYRTARLYAFQLEFLAKFLRKSIPANLETFERLLVLTKDIEDRLGAFNEIDEMIVFCKKREINLAEGTSASDYFIKQRDSNYAELKKWMKASGWSGKLTAIDQVSKLLGDLENLDEVSLRKASIKKMNKVLLEIQENAGAGAYGPKKSSGYTMKEVEPKVHELRREIRKIPMYASYLNGVFELSSNAKSNGKAYKRALKQFAPLEKTSLAKSPFAKLPKAKIKEPLKIPLPFYLAITKYVSELGNAKDWAQNLRRLQEAGIQGQVSFDQLDTALKDVYGRPESFNAMAARTIAEINDTQIFRHMAEYFTSQEK